MEAYSLKESLKFMESYTLNDHDECLIKSVISNHAIEGLYASSQDIDEMVQILWGKRRVQEIVDSYLQAFKAGKTSNNYLIALNHLLGPKSLDSFTKNLLLSAHFPTQSLIELQQKQKSITLKQELSLRIGSLQGDLSYEHLKRIHRSLFVSVYSWAGLDRYEMDLMGQFGKEDMYFCLGAFIPKEANILFGLLHNAHFYKGLCKKDYIQHISLFYADLYYLQPFREGNGQSMRLFMEELAKVAGYTLNLALIPQNTLNHALKQSHKGQLEELTSLITIHLKDSPCF